MTFTKVLLFQQRLDKIHLNDFDVENDCRNTHIWSSRVSSRLTPRVPERWPRRVCAVDRYGRLRRLCAQSIRRCVRGECELQGGTRLPHKYWITMGTGTLMLSNRTMQMVYQHLAEPYGTCVYTLDQLPAGTSYYYSGTYSNEVSYH